MRGRNAVLLSFLFKIQGGCSKSREVDSTFASKVMFWTSSMTWRASACQRPVEIIPFPLILKSTPTILKVTVKYH